MVSWVNAKFSNSFFLLIFTFQALGKPNKNMIWGAPCVRKHNSVHDIQKRARFSLKYTNTSEDWALRTLFTRYTEYTVRWVIANKVTTSSFVRSFVSWLCVNRKHDSGHKTETGTWILLQGSCSAHIRTLLKLRKIEMKMLKRQAFKKVFGSYLIRCSTFRQIKLIAHFNPTLSVYDGILGPCRSVWRHLRNRQSGDKTERSEWRTLKISTSTRSARAKKFNDTQLRGSKNLCHICFKQTRPTG